MLSPLERPKQLTLDDLPTVNTEEVEPPQPAPTQDKKSSRDYWDESSMIYFVDGIGYGLTPELRTIPLGTERTILECFKTGILPDSLKPIQRQILSNVLEVRKELLDDGETVEVKRPGDFRSRSARIIKRRAANLRQAKKGKRLPIRKA